MKKEKAIEITDRVVEYCLYGLIFFIPVSKSAIEILATLAILAYLVKKALAPDFGFLKNYTNLFLALFAGFCSLSLFNSGAYLKMSLAALIFKWLEYVFLFIIAEDILRRTKTRRNCLFILLGVSFFVGIDGLTQRFLGMEFLRQRHLLEIKEGMSAVTGPFKHYNDFAAYLVLMLPLGIALWFRDSPLRGQSLTRKRLYRAGLFFLIGLLGLSLLFTFSRGGWFGFLAAMALMLVLSRRWKIILPVVCIFVLVVILTPGLRGRLLFSFQSGGDAGRFGMWEGALAMIKENPFLGKGLGTFMNYFPRYTNDSGFQYAHNCYLQMWAEIGLFGLLSFLLFVGSVLYKGIRVLRDSPLNRLWTGLGGDSPFILLGLICGIFGFLVHSFFDTQLYSLQLSVLFWVMLGLVMSIGTVPLSDS